MTYYNISVPELPFEFIQYCNSNNYTLSVKKKQIIAHILKLTHDTDIDTLLRNIRTDEIKLSQSSIYLVLQWLTIHGFVSKTMNELNQVVYKPVN
ncbi:MAG: hypothetical protein JWR38_2188 [Mucilaginibacter sp.]|nr:hypothetical protein [Mucilaginibacter sp.]